GGGVPVNDARFGIETDVGQRHPLNMQLKPLEKSVALGFGAVAVLDVHARAEPFDAPPFLILVRHALVEEPAVNPVRATKAKLALERSASPLRLSRISQRFLAVVGVQGVSPAGSQKLLFRQTRVVAPPLVAIIAFAVRVAGVNTAWQAVGQHPIAFFARRLLL